MTYYTNNPQLLKEIKEEEVKYQKEWEAQFNKESFGSAKLLSEDQVIQYLRKYETRMIEENILINQYH